MTNSEQKLFIESNYSKQIEAVHNYIEIDDYRAIEDVIDEVSNDIFTRYCVTLLIDELISFETENFSEEE